MPECPQITGPSKSSGFKPCVSATKVFERIKDNASRWEDEPLVGLAKEGELASYEHSGFWQPMDTLRDKNFLEALWASGKAPWKIW